MSRCAHHRETLTVDLMRRFRNKLRVLFAVARALQAVLEVDIPGAPLAYKAARLRARVALEEAMPLLLDLDGRAWE